MRVRALMVLCVALAAFEGRASTGAVAQEAEQSAQVKQWVTQRDFNAIAQKLEADLSSEARFADGTWRAAFLSAQFASELKRQLQDDAQWQSVLVTLGELARTQPVVALLHARAHNTRAWMIRGPGYARDVRPQDWAPFRQHLASARDILDARKQELARYPLWYSSRMTLALELDEAGDVAKALFEEGRARHPSYHPIYAARLRQLSPQWGGSKDAEIAFLGEVADPSQPGWNESMYVRLALSIRRTQPGLLGDRRFNRQVLAASSDLLAQKFPDPWNLERLFYLACHSSDRGQARKFLDQLDGPSFAAIWDDDPEMHGICVQYATGELAPTLLRTVDPRTKEVRELLLK